ncbi:MAG: glycoside hydrolase [Bacteroidota bacterium]
MKRIFIISAGMGLAFIYLAVGAVAQQKTIYIAPDCHTDFMWSANQDQYMDAFVEMLDYYIQQNEGTAGEPYAFRSKWNCDGSYWVYAYSKQRSEVQFEKLISQIRSGAITVPMNTLNSVHGAAPTEAAIRDMYYAGSLERTCNLDLDLAFNMEDHVMPLGLSSIWAGAGARYSWHGVCDCATKVKGLYSRPREFYWYTGLDGRRILMKWQSLTTDKKYNKGYSNQFPGGYAEAWKPGATVNYYKNLMRDSLVYPYEIAAGFGMGWDNLKITTDEYLTVAREYSDNEFSVVVSNEIDFFKDFERQYGDQLPSESLSSGGTEWGYGLASLAEVSASVKRSMEKLRAAEALYTMVAMKDPGFAIGLSGLRERAWIACGLYFEHDWTADSPGIAKGERATWQREIAGELAIYVDSLYRISVAGLGAMIPAMVQSPLTFFAFNPLGWVRTDYCDYAYDGSPEIRVIETEDQKEVPFQIIQKEGRGYLRIRADSVPSLGFKSYAILKGGNQEYNDAAQYTGNVLENPFYAVTVSSRGQILSLIDKTNGNRECIEPRDDLYANDLGRCDNETNGSLQIENAGPVSVTLLARSVEPLVHDTRITLFSFQRRIEIENHINQPLGSEPVTFSFSFKIKNPETWHEEVGALLRAAPASRGGHYAETNCRLDWLPFNHFVAVTGSGHSMVLSNRDTYFMKPGNSGIETLDYTSPQIHVLAAGQVDADLNLGFPDQDGDTSFTDAFALGSLAGDFNATGAMKFSMEHQNPLVSGHITGKTPCYSHQESLLSISDPNVLAWAVKPAEEGIGKGVILRVWNVGDQESDCTLSFTAPLSGCKQTSHVETDDTEVKVSGNQAYLRVLHNGLQTFRILYDPKQVTLPGQERVFPSRKSSLTGLNTSTTTPSSRQTAPCTSLGGI